MACLTIPKSPNWHTPPLSLLSRTFNPITSQLIYTMACQKPRHADFPSCVLDAITPYLHPTLDIDKFHLTTIHDIISALDPVLSDQYKYSLRLYSDPSDKLMVRKSLRDTIQQLARNLEDADARERERRREMGMQLFLPCRGPRGAELWREWVRETKEDLRERWRRWRIGSGSTRIPAVRPAGERMSLGMGGYYEWVGRRLVVSGGYRERCPMCRVARRNMMALKAEGGYLEWIGGGRVRCEEESAKMEDREPDRRRMGMELFRIEEEDEGDDGGYWFGDHCEGTKSVEMPKEQI